MNDDKFKSAVGRVKINVGGFRHECYISTIQSYPETRLNWIVETALKIPNFDPDLHEFFFDRHAGCFESILNYCRTGMLHCPHNVCGPLFEQVLIIFEKFFKSNLKKIVVNKKKFHS